MAKLTFFLDARHVSVKTGEAPLKIALSHRSHSCYIGLDVSVKPINWDCKKLKICSYLSSVRKNYCQIEESCQALSLTELPLPKE